MALKENSSNKTIDGVERESSHKLLRHTHFNSVTGELDFFFPMEIEDPVDKEYARLNDLKIGWTLLGFRVFEAIMVPCKNKTYDATGKEIYLDTSSEEQHRIYKDLIKDEMDKQEKIKKDGRCTIADSHGGTKRCPLRVKNPAYVLGGDQPKTIAKKCEGCPYECYRQAHTFIELSCLEHENAEGEVESYEVPTPRGYYSADKYLKLSEEFVTFVRERKPKLAPLAEKLTEEYTKSDAGRELGDASSTVTSRTEKLKELVTQFLDTAIIF